MQKVDCRCRARTRLGRAFGRSWRLCGGACPVVRSAGHRGGCGRSLERQVRRSRLAGCLALARAASEVARRRSGLLWARDPHVRRKDLVVLPLLSGIRETGCSAAPRVGCGSVRSRVMVREAGREKSGQESCQDSEKERRVGRLRRRLRWVADGCWFVWQERDGCGLSG